MSDRRNVKKFKAKRESRRPQSSEYARVMSPAQSATVSCTSYGTDWRSDFARMPEKNRRLPEPEAVTIARHAAKPRRARASYNHRTSVRRI